MVDRDPLWSELESLGAAEDQSTDAPQVAQEPEVGVSETARQLQDEGYFDGLARQFGHERETRTQRAVEESQGWSENGVVRSVRDFFNRPEGQDYGPQSRRGVDALNRVGVLSPEERQAAAQAELETAEGTAAAARRRADAVPQLSPELSGPGLMVPRNILAMTRGLFNADAVKQETRLARAQSMLRGEAELPQYAEWRALTESGAKTVADMFTTLPIQYAGIVGGYAMGGGEFQDNRLYQFGQSVERAVQQAFPGDKARQFEYSHTLVQGLASTMAFGGQGAIAHLLGAGPKGQLALIALSGMAAQTPPEFARVTQAMERGDATERDRIIAVLANSALGATEAAPFANTIGGNARGIAGRLARGGEQAVEEMGQEALQQGGQNVTRMLTYDPKQDPYEGVLESMVVAAISGFGYGSAFSGGGRQQGERPPVVEARIQTPGAQPAPQAPAGRSVPEPAPAQPVQPQLPPQVDPALDPFNLERFAPAPELTQDGETQVSAPVVPSPETPAQSEELGRIAAMADRPSDTPAAPTVLPPDVLEYLRETNPELAERYGSVEPPASGEAGAVTGPEAAAAPTLRERLEALNRGRQDADPALEATVDANLPAYHADMEDVLARLEIATPLADTDVRAVARHMARDNLTAEEALERHAVEAYEAERQARAQPETIGVRQAPQAQAARTGAAPRQPAGAQPGRAGTAELGTAGARPAGTAAPAATGEPQRGAEQAPAAASTRDAAGDASPVTEPTPQQRSFLNRILGQKKPLKWSEVQGRLRASPEQMEALRQEALAEGLLRRDRHGVYRRTAKVAAVAEAGMPSLAGQNPNTLSIPPDVRIDNSIRIRQALTGKPVSPLVRSAAIRLLARLGRPQFTTILSEVKKDGGLKVADVRDLAHLVGYPPKAKDTKAEAFRLIAARHLDQKGFLERQARSQTMAAFATLEEREAEARAFMESPEWKAAAEEPKDRVRNTSKQSGFLSDVWRASRQYVGPDGRAIQGFNEAAAFLATQAEAQIPGGFAGRDKQAFIIIGYPGAGKSTLAEAVRDAFLAAHITADDAKPLIPEYQGGKNTGGVQKESGYLAESAAIALGMQGKNMILETLGTDIGIAERTKVLENAGYSVALVFADMPKAIAMERAVARQREDGRTVPLRRYDDLKPEAVYANARSNGVVDEAARLTWDEAGQSWQVSEISAGLESIRSAIGQLEVYRGRGRSLAGPERAGQVADAQPGTEGRPGPADLDRNARPKKKGSEPGSLFAFQGQSRPYSQIFQARLPEVAAAIQRELERMLPADVPVRMMDRLFVGPAAADERFSITPSGEMLLEVALSGGMDVAKIKGFHGVTHILRERGLWSDKEWNLLVEHTGKTGMADRLNATRMVYDGRPGTPMLEGYRHFYTQQAQGLGMSEAEVTADVAEKINQELVAALAEDFIRGRMAGEGRPDPEVSYGKTVDALLDRIAKFFDAVRRALNSIGITQLDQILAPITTRAEDARGRDAFDALERARTGEVARRAEGGRREPTFDPFPNKPSPEEYHLSTEEGMAALELLMGSQELAAFGYGPRFPQRGWASPISEWEEAIRRHFKIERGTGNPAHILANTWLTALAGSNVIALANPSPEHLVASVSMAGAGAALSIDHARDIINIRRKLVEARAREQAQTQGISGSASPQSMFALKAFHGSPHDFDRFDISRIGTGEGAQAFGHGLYFSQAEDVARIYQKALAERGDIKVGGKPLSSYQYLLHDSVDQGPGFAYYALLHSNGDVQAARQRLVGHPHEASALRTLGSLEDLGVEAPEPGRLYEVSLDVEPEQLLDWDKALKEQSPAVKKALNAVMDRYAKAINASGKPRSGFLNIAEMKTGADWRTAMRKLTDVSDAELSDVLREAGIPGIRYLDQGSRSKGEGSYNFVIFDDSLVKIVAKDGKPVSDAERADVLEQTQDERGQEMAAFTPDLDMSPQARKQRAEAMGFDTSRVWYHGTDREFTAFDTSQTGTGHGTPGDPRVVWLTSSRAFAQEFADEYAKAFAEVPDFKPSSNLLSLYVRGRQKTLGPKEMPARLVGRDGETVEWSPAEFHAAIEQARSEGYDTVLFKNVQDVVGAPADQLVAFDPSDIRSVDAEFNPAEDGSPQLMAAFTPESKVESRPFSIPGFNGSVEERVKASGERIRTYAVKPDISGTATESDQTLLQPSQQRFEFKEKPSEFGIAYGTTIGRNKLEVIFENPLDGGKPVPNAQKVSFNFTVDGSFDSASVAPTEQVGIFHAVRQALDEFIAEYRPRQIGFDSFGSYKRPAWRAFGENTARRHGGTFEVSPEHGMLINLPEQPVARRGGEEAVTSGTPEMSALPRSSFIVSEQPDGSWEVSFFKAEPDAPVADVFNAIESDIGNRLSPKGWLTPQGYRYWQSADPQAVRYHQNAGDVFGGMYASPRAVEFGIAVLGKPDTAGTATDDALSPHRAQAEVPSKAAVQVRGEVFEDIHHGGAYAKAVSKLGDFADDELVDGFVTNTGRFVTREEATQLALARGYDAGQPFVAGDINPMQKRIFGTRGGGDSAVKSDTGKPDTTGTASDDAQLHTARGGSDETILGSAVKIDEQVYTGRTHAEAMEKASAALGFHADDFFDRYQDAGAQWDLSGFLTSSGRYVGREEAYAIASKTGQVSEASRSKRELDSIHLLPRRGGDSAVKSGTPEMSELSRLRSNLPPEALASERNEQMFSFSGESNLDMSPAARKARAEAQGFDTSRVLYHGTKAAGFEAFDGARPIWLTDKPHIANLYTGQIFGQASEEGSAVLPVYARLANPLVVDSPSKRKILEVGFDHYADKIDKAFKDWKAQALKAIPRASLNGETRALRAAITSLKTADDVARLLEDHAYSGEGPVSLLEREYPELYKAMGTVTDPAGIGLADIFRDAQAAGHDGVVFKNIRDVPNSGAIQDQYVVFDPSNIRSTNAEFDPSQEGSPVLMAAFRGDNDGGMDEYRGQHGAPDSESGSPIHDVTLNGIYPADFYSPNGLRYYGTGDDALDVRAYNKIMSIRGKPDEKVAVYRAIPEVKGKVKGVTLGPAHINPGDWVTIIRDYAKDHGESALNGKYSLAKRMVPARELFTAGDSFLEWGWSPSPEDAASAPNRGSLSLEDDSGETLASFSGNRTPPYLAPPGQAAQPASPAGGNQGEVRGLADIIADLKETLGLTTTQGRYGLTVVDRAAGRRFRFPAQPNVRGQYDRNAGVARIRIATDIDAIAHEGGHHLERVFGTEIDALKQAHAEELGTPPAPNAPLPPMSPQGYSGLELDADTQGVLVKAATAMRAWRAMAAQRGQAKSRGRVFGRSSVDDAAYHEASSKAAVATGVLERRLGKPIAQALIGDILGDARIAPGVIGQSPLRRAVQTQGGTSIQEIAPEDMAAYVTERYTAPTQPLPPVPAGYIRLYRGTGNNIGDASNSAFFSTDINKARLYGAVQYIDVPYTRESMGRFVQGHGGADEYVTDAPEIINATRPVPAGQPKPRVVSTPTALQISEGFAEFFRRYITDPDTVQRDMPGVYSAFEEFLDAADPAMLENLEKLQLTALSADYKAYRNATALERLKADTVSEADRRLTTRAKEWLKAIGQGETYSGFASVVYEAGVDENHPHYLMTRRLLEQADENRIVDQEGRALSLAVHENPYKLMRSVGDAFKTGLRWIQDGMPQYRHAAAGFNVVDAAGKVLAFRPTLAAAQAFAASQTDPVTIAPHAATRSKSLHDALVLAMGAKWEFSKYQGFGSYLIARRGVEEWTRFMQGNLERPPLKSYATGQPVDEITALVGIIRDYEKANPNFSAAAQSVYDFLWAQAVHDFQAGRLTQAELDYRATRKHFYVPYSRDMRDIVTQRGFGGRTPKFSKDKTFKGSARSIINPLETIIDQTFHRAAATHVNDVMKTYKALSLAAGPGAAEIMEPVTKTEVIEANNEAFRRLEAELMGLGYDAQDAREMIKRVEADFGDMQMLIKYDPEHLGAQRPLLLTLWENGERTYLRINDPAWAANVYNSLNGIGRELSSLFIEVVAKPATLLRVGVTTHPAFIGPNIIRDMWQAFTLTGSVLNPRTWPGVTQIRGLYHELAQTDMARLYQEVGGIMGGQNVASLSKVRDKADVMALKEKGLQIRPVRLSAAATAGGAAGFAVGGPIGAGVGALFGAALHRGPRHFFSDLAHFADMSETATRLGVFTHAFDAAMLYSGWKKDIAGRFVPDPTYAGRPITPYEAAQEAAYVARDLIDFGRRGGRMLAAARLVPFMNANIQGLDKAVRQLLARSDRGMQLSTTKLIGLMAAGATTGLVAGTAAGAVATFAAPAIAANLAARSAAVRALLAPFTKKDMGIPLSRDDERALGASAKAFTNLFLYTLILLAFSLLYADDDEYQQITPRVKVRNQPVKIDGEWYMFPKAFEWALPSVIIEAALDSQFRNDPRFAERVREGLYETLTPPGIPQTGRLWRDIGANYNSLTGRPIVAEHFRADPPEIQFNAYASQFAIAVSKFVNERPALRSTVEGVGGTVFATPRFELTPAIVDYALSTGLGYWGKDAQKASNVATVGGNRLVDYPLVGTAVQRFTLDPNRMSDAVDAYWKAMGQEHEGYRRAANGYKRYNEMYGPQGANTYLATLTDPEQRAYALLDSSGSPAAKRGHPLNRLKGVVTASMDMERDIALGRLADTTSPRDPQAIVLSPARTNEVRDALAAIRAVEAHNTMVVLRHRQFADRQIRPVQPALDLLRASSPEAFAEYELRGRRQKVGDFADAAQNWPERREELLRDWQEAVDENAALIRDRRGRTPKRLPIGTAREAPRLEYAPAQ